MNIKKQSIDMLTIPEEITSRIISTRRIGRISKRSDYHQVIECMEFDAPK
jgi:hypothetical protein